MDIATLDRLDSSYMIVQQLIADLPDESIDQMLGGTGADLSSVFNILVDTTYEVLYGDQTGPGAFEHLGYVDRLGDTLEETLRMDNFNYFVLSVLPDFDVNWHHLEWGDIVQRYLYFCVIAARDHGKSYWFSNAYLAWKMYRFRKPGPGIRHDYTLSQLGYLFSFSAQQSRELLEILKSTIENNPILRDRLFPASIHNWTKARIIAANGAQLRARGIGNSVRGAHPGYIMVDDALKDNSMYSQTQREKTIEYLHSVIMNMIVPQGQVGMVGTPFHQADMYAALKKLEDWHVREYPAIFPDGRLLWPRRHSMKSLRRKFQSQGRLRFSRENLCRPISNEATIFPYEILRKSIVRMENYTLVKNIQSHPVKFTRVVVGCDFAISGNVGADYSVFTVWGVDESKCMWLLYMYRQSGAKYGEQKAAMKGIHANFQPMLMLLEANQMQMIFVQEADADGLPVKPHTTTAKNKHDLRTGLPGLSLLFEQGRIKIPYGDVESRNTADLIFSELSSVTYTEKGLESVDQHDDIAMSFWLGSLAANYDGAGFRSTLI